MAEQDKPKVPSMESQMTLLVMRQRTFYTALMVSLVTGSIPYIHVGDDDRLTRMLWGESGEPDETMKFFLKQNPNGDLECAMGPVSGQEAESIIQWFERFGMELKHIVSDIETDQEA